MKNNFVFIGRFQPFHKGHLSIIQKALNNPKCDKLIILIGSTNIARDIRNPFTFDERKELISLAIDKDLQSIRSTGKDINVYINPIEDSIYNNSKWLSAVQQSVKSVSNKNDTFTLTGFLKDDTQYLKYFPQYNNDLLSSNDFDITSTEIRQKYFKGEELNITNQLPNETLEFLQKFKRHNNGETYKYLQEEYKFLKNYKEKFKSLPYQIPFVTGDAIVVCCGHALIIKRKKHPGKNLFAIPGGFFKNDDGTQIDTAIRELVEETRLKIPELFLKACIKKSDDFSDKNRSLRGRVLTKAVLINLPDQYALPKVKPADDAIDALWMPISSIIENKDKFFEDHYQILECMLGL